MSQAPIFHVIGDGDRYLAAWIDPAITFDFFHVRDHSEGVSAELKVTLNGYLVHWGRLTLASARGRAEITKDCVQTGGPSHPWRKMVDETCLLVDEARRSGAPIEVLRSHPARPGRFLVPGLIPVEVSSILYGDGGTGKSLLALALAMCGILGAPLGPLKVGPVQTALYLDWETSREAHEVRKYGLEQELGPVPDGRLLYRKMSRPLADDPVWLRAAVAEHKVDLIICDSAALASGPEPETAAAATQTMNVLRSCSPATSLVLAHVTKLEATKTQGHARPFGSAFWSNIARSAIAVTGEREESVTTLTLTQTKTNSQYVPPTAVRFVFGGDEESDDYAILIRRGEPTLARASLSTRILAELRGGAQTAQQLAAFLGVSDNAIRARLNELDEAHRVVRLTAHSGGKMRKNLWGLRLETAQDEPH